MYHDPYAPQTGGAAHARGELGESDLRARDRAKMLSEFSCRTAASVHEALLQRILRTRLYSAANNYAAAQEDAWAYGALQECVDIGFALDLHEDYELGYEPLECDRDQLMASEAPLRLLTGKAATHPGGIVLWLLWMHDHGPAPIVIACHANSEAAAWAIATGGRWWPIYAHACALQATVGCECAAPPLRHSTLVDRILRDPSAPPQEVSLAASRCADGSDGRAAQQKLVRACCAIGERAARLRQRTTELELALEVRLPTIASDWAEALLRPH